LGLTYLPYSYLYSASIILEIQLSFTAMSNLITTRTRKISSLIFLPVCFAFLFSCSPQNNKEIYLVDAPAGSQYCQINENGATVIPNGRILTPAGIQVKVAPHPYGLVLSHDGQIAITSNSGVSPFSVSIIRDLYSANPHVNQIPEGNSSDEGILESVFMGLAVSPDNTKLFISGGSSNKVFVFNLLTGEKTDSIDCAVNSANRNFSDGYLGDMVLDKAGKTLYVVDQINFCVNVLDAETNKLKFRVPVGRYPFGLILSPDEKKLFVANVGMYEYSPLEGLNRNNMKTSGLQFPTSAYLSEEGEKGYKINDSISVPGLGDPHAPESFSVWVLNLEDSAHVISKIKTGYQVGEKIEGIPAVGGSSPNSLVASDKYVFVSNGNNDLVSVIDPKKDSIVHSINLFIDERFQNLRGIIPFGLALSPDQKTLYVAESGINAIGVIDAESFEVLGHIPVGWFPSKLKVTPDGKKLVVANAKGFGSGPNGGSSFIKGPNGSYIGNLMFGTVSIIDVPERKKLPELTSIVLENNFDIKAMDPKKSENPIPQFPGEKESPIKYIVFISKENRTYDEVFGQIEQGNGDSSLARYGMGVSFKNREKTKSVENADIMVNHHALAKEFSMSDNFYVDADVSADGHRWLTCTYPNEWVETSTAASYGGGRSFKMNSSAPGRFAFVGASGAIYPEDYNEAGSMWEHFERNNIRLHNFGFSLELASSYEDSTLKYAGVRYLVNYPVPAPVYSNSSKLYPTYNMAIPDQFRADIFIREYRENWIDKNSEPPQFISVLLPNDHGAGERVHAGYPFRESYMCDNDLALGRIVEFLSSTPYWKNMAIFVTEDDAQDGRDHVDAHRSILMMISPYAKKNHVSHVHYSFGSIFKTFWNILGIPYLNQYDAGATDMREMFTDEPDLTPYHALPVDIRIFDPQKALDPFDENFDWKAVADSPKLDNPDDMDKE